MMYSVPSGLQLALLQQAQELVHGERQIAENPEKATFIDAIEFSIAAGRPLRRGVDTGHIQAECDLWLDKTCLGMISC
jgi:hypothetical protein